MSDEIKVTVKRRVVRRNPTDKLYYVAERVKIEPRAQYSKWKNVGRGYAHSTSAYAQLGRIISRENE